MARSFLMFQTDVIADIYPALSYKIARCDVSGTGGQLRGEGGNFVVFESNREGFQLCDGCRDTH